MSVMAIFQELRAACLNFRMADNPGASEKRAALIAFSFNSTQILVKPTQDIRYQLRPSVGHIVRRL